MVKDPPESWAQCALENNKIMDPKYREIKEFSNGNLRKVNELKEICRGKSLVLSIIQKIIRKDQTETIKNGPHPYWHSGLLSSHYTYPLCSTTT